MHTHKHKRKAHNVCVCVCACMCVCVCVYVCVCVCVCVCRCEAIVVLPRMLPTFHQVRLRQLQCPVRAAHRSLSQRLRHSARARERSGGYRVLLLLGPRVRKERPRLLSLELRLDLTPA